MGFIISMGAICILIGFFISILIKDRGRRIVAIITIPIVIPFTAVFLFGEAFEGLAILLLLLVSCLLLLPTLIGFGIGMLVQKANTN